MEIVIALIATIAAAISAICAYKSWKYNREISKATLSLTAIGIDAKTKTHRLLRLFLKNIGRETLKIVSISGCVINLQNKEFKYSTERPKIIHLPCESEFEYLFKLPLLHETQTGIIFKMKYKGVSEFSKREETASYYYVYDKTLDNLRFMKDEEYQEIKESLPNEFKNY